MRGTRVGGFCARPLGRSAGQATDLPRREVEKARAGEVASTVLLWGRWGAQGAAPQTNALIVRVKRHPP